MMSLEQALRAPMWDGEFWDAMEEGEKSARKALFDLWEDSMEGDGCSCDTHVVNTVLEAIFPFLTEQIIRIYSEVETGACGRGCSRTCGACDA